MNVGIVGSEAAKFTPTTEMHARAHIRGVIISAQLDKEGCVTVVSGHCHLGGVDIYAEECADEINVGFQKPWVKKLIFPPKTLSWASGFKPRNIQIAQQSDIVYVITVKELPPGYTGMKFEDCYHCDRRMKLGKMLDQEYRKRYHLPYADGYEQPHVKSGACWTAWYAVEKFGKDARWIVI